MSCVGYLSLPDGIKEEWDREDKDHYPTAGGIEMQYGQVQLFSTNTVRIRPKVGDYYLFPWWMYHMVYPFRTKGERRYFSFNVFGEPREEKKPKLINGESIIRVSASGICGSDMHAYHGKDNRRIPPLILGHEISGIIHKGKSIGKEVILNPLITCGNCDYCKDEKEHLCNKRIILGMNRPIERQGGFAEYVSIPDKNIYELPNNLSMKEAPISEPCAVAFHAVELGEKELSKPTKDNKVLVIGAVAIGLLCGLILSKIKNCKDIVIVDPNDKRLKQSLKYYETYIIILI